LTLTIMMTNAVKNQVAYRVYIKKEIRIT